MQTIIFMLFPVGLKIGLSICGKGRQIFWQWYDKNKHKNKITLKEDTQYLSSLVTKFSANKHFFFQV